MRSWFISTLLGGLVGCAGSPRVRAHQTAVVQKTAVDGIGNAYLDYCEIVLTPRCVAQDKASSDREQPQTKDQRVACLRPCDSQTAETIQTHVDYVISAQTVLFEAIRDGATEAELQASRAQLARAVAELTALLQSTGVMQHLTEALEGIDGPAREATR